ncbi:MAG: LapA family protein [Actinomycetota bacterium]|nr:LapA family protein [Actinomycetota bacterium]
MTDKPVTPPRAGGSSPGPGRAHLARLVVIVLVLAALLAFILGNTEKTRISFLFVHGRFSLIWVLLVTNLLGFLAGYLVHGRAKTTGRRGRKRSKG